jgi:hypothetical protein
MKNILCALLAASSCALANEACLNQVSMNLSAEEWVVTQTAQVTVAVNAAVTQQQSGDLSAALLEKLASVSGVKDWRLLNLSRQENDTGLIAVNAEAMARLSNVQVSMMQSKLEKLNKPGEKYSIQNISYVPSLQEVNSTETLLRSSLYAQVSQSLDALNKAFPATHYQVYRVNFVGGRDVVNAPMAAYVRTVGGAEPKLDVSNKMQMSANVIYAAPIPGCIGSKN